MYSNDIDFLQGLVIFASETTYHVGAVSSTGRGNAGCIMSILIGLETISNDLVPNVEQLVVRNNRSVKLKNLLCVIF